MPLDRCRSIDDRGTNAINDAASMGELMVFAPGVQARGCLSTKRRVQRPRKPRTCRPKSPVPFDGIPLTPSAFKLVWQTPELFKGRYVLEDLRRVLVFEGKAVVLEASEHQLEHNCLACAVRHQSRNWDCVDQCIRRAAICRGQDDEVAYSPLTGRAEGVLRLLGTAERTRHRRLTHQPCTFRTTGQNQ